MADTRVDVEGGKYTFGIDERTGDIYVLRFGEPWIGRLQTEHGIGSKALIALVSELAELRAQLGIPTPS
jgi:hypothetical protein